MAERLDFTDEQILITVKTYPTPSRRTQESSCTAGVTRSREWLRFFPIHFRQLDKDQQFRKYQWISERIKKAKDPRPESHTLDNDSIKIIGKRLSAEDGWAKRREFLNPLRYQSVEKVREAQAYEGISLAFVGPLHIDALVIEPTESHWTQQELATLQRQSFFDQGSSAILEKISYDFSYRFHCNDPHCNGHKIKIVDWEIYQSYRRWQRQYGNEWEAKLRLRYEHEMQQKYDTHFFIGTMRAHPKTWIIVGLFYPPKREGWQPTLL